jgi:NADPH2:quinone reductase
VGSFAVQIARAGGARVLATAGTENQETLESLGVDVAIDYTQGNVAETVLEDTAGTGVDAVLDAVGGDTVVNSIPATRPYGRIATILGGQGDFTPLYVNNQVLHGVLLARERARLDEIARIIERGQIRPLVDEVLALDEVGKAHERLESGHGRGKVVLRVSHQRG